MNPYDLLIAPFVDLGHLRMALAGSVAIAVGCAPLGVFLILRRMALAGDVMAHALLPGVAVAFLLAGQSQVAMMAGGLVTGLVVAWLSSAAARGTGLAEDSSLAVFYLVSLALGVLIVSATGSDEELLHLLFGSLGAVDAGLLVTIAATTSVTVIALALLARALIAECFDPVFLASVGGRGALIHMAFMTLVVINLVGGFSTLGALMVVGIMMLPAVAARFWATGIGGQVGCAVGIAVASSVVGLLVAHHAGLPLGPSVIIAAGLAAMLSMAFGRHGSLRLRYGGGTHLEA